MSYDRIAEVAEWLNRFKKCDACENGHPCDTCECYECWSEGDIRIGEE